MTDRKQAIATLTEHLDHWKRLLFEGICTKDEGERTIDALTFAIESIKVDSEEIEILQKRSYLEGFHEALKMSVKQEPCEDCISRKAILEEIENGIKAGNYEEGYEEYPHINNMNDIIECIKYADSVQPKPKTGHWIDGDRTRWKCSNCGYGVLDWNNTPYCPNCGAKMQTKSEDKE